MFHLKEGDKAPDFTGVDQDGNIVQLYKIKEKVILYFYPKDNTPGCTVQACNLRDNYSHLQKKGYRVIGVSADSETSHQKFIQKFTLPFTLIADTDKTILQAYGVFGPKKFMGKVKDGIHRTTFVINENKIITQIILKVDTANHTEQII